MPAMWSTTHHEYQVGPARHLLQRAVPTAADDGQATLLVFARDSGHRHGSGWRMAPVRREGLRLRRLRPQDGLPELVDVALHVDPDCGFSTFTRHLPGGTYLLGVQRQLRQRRVWNEMVLHVAAPGWRTEVWLDAVDDSAAGAEGRRFDLESASVHVAPRGQPGTLEDAAARHTELLRDALVDELHAPGSAPAFGTQVLLPDDPGALGPIGVLPAAALAARRALLQTDAVQAACAWLGRHWSAASADVAALATIGRRGPPHPPVLAPDAVPMLTPSWDLLARTPGALALALPVQRTVGSWRMASSLWVMTQRPDDPAGTAPVCPSRRWRGSRPAPADLAAALGPRTPAPSPLHQALRAALIDARDKDDPAALPAVVDRVAGAAGLGREVVLEALADLERSASAAR